MVQHWVNFAKYGNPSIPGHKWGQVEEDSTDYMEITDRNFMKKFSEEEMDKFHLWKNVFKLREALEPKTSPIAIRLKPKPNLNIKSYTHQFAQYKNLINFD